MRSRQGNSAEGAALHSLGQRPRNVTVISDPATTGPAPESRLQAEARGGFIPPIPMQHDKVQLNVVGYGGLSPVDLLECRIPPCRRDSGAGPVVAGLLLWGRSLERS